MRRRNFIAFGNAATHGLTRHAHSRRIPQAYSDIVSPLRRPEPLYQRSLAMLESDSVVTATLNRFINLLRKIFNDRHTTDVIIRLPFRVKEEFGSDL